MKHQSEANWMRLFNLWEEIMLLIMAELKDPYDAYFVATLVGEYQRYFFRKSIPMCMEMDASMMTKLDREVKRSVHHLLKPEMFTPPLDPI